MRIRRFALVALLAVLVVPFAREIPATPAQAAITVPYAVASESYYTMDTENGRISVRVHGEYQNMQSKDLATLPVWVMPGAENILVTTKDQTLETKLTPGSEEAGQAGWVDATLPQPLKQNLRITLDATYDIPPRTGGKLMTLEPGLIETPFIGQGPGSFVLVDVPESGDNYLDPGCLKATDQPGDVKAAGNVRWVCGEVTIIALSADDPDLLKRCAAMDDKCRQRTLISVFSAYAQSITDESKAGKLETDLTMPDGRSVKMVLKYFKRDQAWADKQFTVAKAAFPKLEELFGFPYAHDQILMRQSHHIENIGALGVAFSRVGEVLLASDTGTDEHVTVHELAHQWASQGVQFDSPFMGEGLAEYAARTLGPELGYTLMIRPWQEIAQVTGNEPLALWGYGATIPFADYWYGRAGDFWFAYETAIGGRDNMKTVLSRIDDEPSLWRLSPGWFMDQGEWVSGKNLDSLFSDWVYNPVTSKTLLEQRRAAHDLVDALQARAAEYGLSGMPSDIYDNLLAWVFDPVAGQVDRANKVLDSYAEVVKNSNEVGLGTPPGVAEAWGNSKIADTQVVVEEQHQAILAILSAAEELKDAPADSFAQKKLAESKELYSKGDYSGAKVAASAGVTAAFNEVTAAKMIEIAKEKQNTFSAGFFGRFGMMWTNPDDELRRAEEALSAGDGTEALKLSRHAYETWDGATQRGIQRLAIAAGVMCALAFLVWFILRKLDAPVAAPKKLGQGHFLEEASERRSWKDWENTP
ncbi:MAG: hypothetical protein AB7N24_08880 [Dehalococcoidia bacterium]